MKGLAALVCGVLFGFGLALSGMTDTARVQGFLDLFGAWVPDLMFVMGGAVLVTLLLFRPVLQRRAPLFAPGFSAPARQRIDGRLLVGSALFGIGWGLYGYCPGPAIAALAYLDWHAALFVLAMVVGMGLHSVLERLAGDRSEAAASAR